MLRLFVPILDHNNRLTHYIGRHVIVDGVGSRLVTGLSTAVVTGSAIGVKLLMAPDTATSLTSVFRGSLPLQVPCLVKAALFQL